MKNIATLILIATVGLTGCTTMQHVKSPDVGYDPHRIKEKKYDRQSTQKLPSNVRNLPAPAQQALAQEVDDLILVVAFDKEGIPVFFKDRETTQFKKIQFPITLTIKDFKTMGIVPFEGSHCLLWSDGSSFSSGGAATAGAFCLLKHQ